jgi:hypothetical protein
MIHRFLLPSPPTVDPRVEPDAFSRWDARS